MNFYVGVTDENWYRFLSSRSFDEVNFWRPRDQNRFQAIPEGAPFLFKLKKPKNVIVGVGYFLAWRRLPIPAAWDAFGQENGTPDYESFVRSLGRLSHESPAALMDRELGSIILGEPTFFEPEDWIEAPEDWANSITQGKTYSMVEPIGAAIWAQVKDRLIGGADLTRVAAVRELELGPTYGQPALAKRRLGQGLFRVMTLENYRGKCCITGESTAPVVEAAHIRPVSQGGVHRLDNGLALRADMHILYDRGLLSVDPDLRIRVSSRIRELYHNGLVYYQHEGQQLRSIPEDPALRPDPDLLDWHYREAFIA